ncbi:MAG: sulfatase-like hydrolase/transferase [Opitutaceae bacterium]|nr:sulfatase-like hydrolase/transferase [Opitutaceae bacterium]
MNHLLRCRLVLFLIVLGTSLTSVAGAAPNLIVILADDLGWADLGHDGSQIETPHLDRLAKEGVKLTHYRSSAPMCSPTRAALLTGRYPHSVGVPELASPTARGNVPVLALAHAAITIPEALKPAGYRSALVGKWHIGYAKENWPRTHGFDEFWGSLIGTPRFWDVKETYANETPIEVSGKGYYTDQLAGKAVEIIRRHAADKQPFFLYLAFNAPHYPLEAPFELVSKYRKIFPDRGLFGIYAAMVEQLDTGIGRVLATLDELKLASDTLILFTSDNGPSAELNHYGPEGADFSNGPHRGYKFGLTEGGLRVPFLARWPGKLPAGVVRSGSAITMDILPTLLDAAGVKPAAGHEIHGQSLLPLLRGEAFARRAPLHWENQQNYAVHDGEWKLVKRAWEPKARLYRPAEDIGEDQNLAEKFPAKVAELTAQHEAWRKRYYPNPVPPVAKRTTGNFPVTAQDP